MSFNNGTVRIQELYTHMLEQAGSKDLILLRFHPEKRLSVIVHDTQQFKEDPTTPTRERHDDYEYKPFFNAIEKRSEQNKNLETITDITFHNPFEQQEQSLIEYMKSHHFGPDGEVHICVSGSRQQAFTCVIHDSTLGPPVGGLRAYDYATDYPEDSIGALLSDNLRLAEGMSYKAAISRTKTGGGKMVRQKNKGETPEIRNLANFEVALAVTLTNYSRGRRQPNAYPPYYTAEDVGNTGSEMDYISRWTPFVICKTPLRGGGGNPSPYTAEGVYSCLLVAAKEAGLYKNKREPLSNVRILLQGLGHCGEEVLQRIHEAGAQIIATDKNKEAIWRIQSNFRTSRRIHCEYFSEQTLHEDPNIFWRRHAKESDIALACALGGTWNPETLQIFKGTPIKIATGSANNQFSEQNPEQQAKEWKQEEIIVPPDYLVNAGGLMRAVEEMPGRKVLPSERTMTKVRGLTKDLQKVFDNARKENTTPWNACIQESRKRMKRNEK